MRRQESPEVRSKSAGRKEAEMRSETQQVYRQLFSHPRSVLRYAPPAVVALGGGGAAHRMHQNDMPPLPGICRDLSEIHWTYAICRSLEIRRLLGIGWPRCA